MKTIIKFFFVACVLIGASVFSCGKEKATASDLNQSATGLVLYLGDPAVDGCGWLIEIDSVKYSPLEFDSKFKMDSLKVMLDYETLSSKWNCGWREPGYTQIRITSIKTLIK